MARMNIAKAAILSLVVFLVASAIVAGLLKLLRHGFSARDNPSWLETIAARTARGAAVPAKARWMKNPVPNTPENLAKARPLTYTEVRPDTQSAKTVVVILKGAEVSIPMESMVDKAVEEGRLSKEIEQVEGEVGRLKTRMEDPAFLSKAPPQVVEKDKQKLATLADKLARLKEQLGKLKEG